jgi:phosphatidylglycerophosphate synthase
METKCSKAERCDFKSRWSHRDPLTRGGDAPHPGLPSVESQTIQGFEGKVDQSDFSWTTEVVMVPHLTTSVVLFSHPRRHLLMDDRTHNSSPLAEIVRVYRESRKKQDIAWNVYVARPLAALVVWILARTPITPNQVTFLGFFVFLSALVPVVILTDSWGLLAGALLIQLAYVLDCADGQLARITGKTSEIGAYFDFFIDEIKANFLVAAFALRSWMTDGDENWLLLGLGGVLLVSTATSLTNFVRRREYAGEEIRPGASSKQPKRPDGLLPGIIWAVQRVASFLVHYPSWIVYIGAIDFISGVDGGHVFLGLYLSVYVLYTAKTSLAVLIRLGHPGYYR